jgi:D-3-phosphoglycerate dehydrogenase
MTKAIGQLLHDRKKKRRILLLEAIHPGAKARLESLGFEVSLESKSFADNDLIQKCKGFDALGIRSKTQVTSQVLSALPELQTVGCFCIGTDQVDLDFANRNGVAVFNAPYSNTRSVAELIISEIIGLSRCVVERSMQMHRGVWQKTANGNNEVRGKTLGIVGYGHIGSQLSIMAESLGMHVIFYDVVKKLPLGNARSCDSLLEVLRRSDFVSLHVPDTTLTQKMIGERELSQMKQGSYLLNASRGMVVDIPALSRALKAKHLAGAAVDVFPSEPASNSEKFVSELQELENVILTPHIGGSTEEAQEAIGQEVAESFYQFFTNGTTAGAVNFPQVDLPARREFPRILNIHRNVPGVLGAINSIVSELGGNIVGQHLATDSNIGYMAMDIGIVKLDEAVKRIASLPTSIRSKVLE